MNTITDTKTTLTVLFASCMVIANVTATKVAAFELPLFGLVAVPAGFLAFGCAYLVTDLLNELYGREYATRVVNGTIIGLIISWGLIYASIAMPSAPFYPLGSEFASILGGGATIITASLITVLLSQNLDVWVFDRIRSATGERHKWLRNIGSTSISQLLDTVLFITLAFAVLPRALGGEITPWAVIPGLIGAQYVMKLLIVGLDTPIFYLGSALLDR